MNELPTNLSSICFCKIWQSLRVAYGQQKFIWLLSTTHENNRVKKIKKGLKQKKKKKKGETKVGFEHSPEGLNQGATQLS